MGMTDNPLSLPVGALLHQGKLTPIQLPVESHGGDKSIQHRTCWAWFLPGRPSDHILQNSLALTPGLDVGS